MKTRRQSFALTRILIAVGVFSAVVLTGGSALGASSNLVQNPSLESAAGDTPSCYVLGGYGTNTFSWKHTGDAHSGSFAERLEVTSLTNGDRKLLSAFDNSCSPGATQGHIYTVSVWYKTEGATQPVIFAFTRGASAGYSWWAQSPRLPSSDTWTNASWTTPAMPGGISNLSVGMGLQSTGAVTIDDLSLIDNNADAPAPPDVTTNTTPTPPTPTPPPATTTTTATPPPATTTTTATPPPPATTTTTAAPPPPTTTTATPPPATTTTTATTPSAPAAPSVLVVPNNMLQNTSLESGSATTPDCWLLGGYGSNGYQWARTTASAHSGRYAELLDVSSFSYGDRKLLSAFNSSCSPATTRVTPTR